MGLGAHHEDELIHLLVLAVHGPAERSILDDRYPRHNGLRANEPSA